MNPESNNPMALHGDEVSALACVLAVATGKPVLFEEDKSGTDKKKWALLQDY
jgi:hypothetical protein